MAEETPKIKLLLVDDEEDFLRSTAAALGRRGFDVQTANNGPRALEMIRQTSFEAVVLDVKMPDMDGMEVFQRLQEDNPNLPVVLLTGHGSIEQAFQATKKGVHDYLTKPCDIEILAERVQKVIKMAADRAPGRQPDETEELGKLPIRVLLVDDEVQFLQTLEKVLSRRNMELNTAENGEQALASLRDSPADVVVLDVKMPGMDGLEVLNKIKKDYPTIEVILLTGHPTVETALEGVKAGAREYIIKPPDIESLSDAIRRARQRQLETFKQRQQKLIRDIQEKYPD